MKNKTKQHIYDSLLSEAEKWAPNIFKWDYAAGPNLIMRVLESGEEAKEKESERWLVMNIQRCLLCEWRIGAMHQGI